MQIQISWLLQKPTDLDLHCLQRQGISGFSRTRVNVQVQGQHPHQWAPLPGSWLAARMADFTPDLQVCLSRGSIAESFYSLRSLSVSCSHVILGLPGPRFPSTCRSKAVLTAPLERSTCPYHVEPWSDIAFCIV